jgi:hypothetical protein
VSSLAKVNVAGDAANPLLVSLSSEDENGFIDTGRLVSIMASSVLSRCDGAEVVSS